jgi:DNA-binding response OmpR family regulator
MDALIVEDCDELREMLSILLMTEGYNVIEVNNAFDAYAIIHNSSSSFDLLITNYELPLINGGQLIEDLINANFSIRRIIVLSGNICNQMKISDLQIKNKNIQFVYKLSLTKKLLEAIYS